MNAPYTTVESRQNLLECADHLARSAKGRHALEAILAWLDADGLSLDEVNQEALLTLLNGAWGAYGMTARDAMRVALARH